MKSEQLNLLEIIESYGIEIEKKDDKFICLCPFHDDHNPSLTITKLDLGYGWYCFPCGEGGGVVDFISKMENLSKMDTFRFIKAKYGINIDIDENKVLLTNIIESLQGRHEYIAGRGISEETVTKYKLGFCSSYKELLDKFGINKNRAYEIGLYDITDHIVYPFFDFEGCFKIGSRSVKEKDYSSSHTTKNWKLSLWGIEHIRSKKVYVFEGYHDVMIASQFSIPAVAMCGTVMHKEYWDQLYNIGVEELIFVPDGDYAGRKLLQSVLDNCDNRFKVKFISIKRDPDDEIKSGEYLDWEPVLPLVWYTEQFKPVSLSDKIDMYTSISKYYCKLKPWEQNLYKQYFSEKFGDEGLDYLVPSIGYDKEAERIVIANCLYSNNIRLDTLQTLDTSDFSSKTFQSIFEFMKTNTVSDILIEKNFGLDFSRYADVMNYKVYVDEVKTISTKMKVMDSLNRYAGRVENCDLNELVGSLSQELIEAIDNKEYIYETKDIVTSVMNKLAERIKNPNVAGIPLNEENFPICNRSLLGFMPKKLIFVSGATGHGKTTLVQNWIDDLIFNKKEKVLFFSLEMTPEEIIEKQLAISSRISGTKILTGSLEQSEYDEIYSNAKKLIDRNLKIVYGLYDYDSIINIAKSLIVREKFRVMFIDYVQLIQVKNRKDRWEQLMDISKGIKTRICNDHGVNTILISQLGKSSLNSTIAEAKDISGSFGMLADADVAMTIRQKHINEIEDKSNAEIFIDKHRYGRDKILIPASFDKGTQIIREV